jgi:hypothetical protein
VRGGRGLASRPKGEGGSLCMRQGAAADVGAVTAANPRPNVLICRDNRAHGGDGPWCMLGPPPLPLNEREGSAPLCNSFPIPKIGCPDAPSWQQMSAAAPTARIFSAILCAIAAVSQLWRRRPPGLIFIPPHCPCLPS